MKKVRHFIFYYY